MNQVCSFSWTKMYNSCGPLHNSCIKPRHWPHDLISLEYLKQESARIFLSGMSKQKWTLSSLNLVGISGSGRNMIKKMRFSWRSGRGLVIWLTFECRRSNGTVERIGVIQIGLKESQVLLLHKNPKKKENFDLILQIWITMTTMTTVVIVSSCIAMEM